MHKVPCSLIHVNLAGGEKSDLLKHNTFSKSITAELWICLQVSQAAVRIRRGAGYRYSQAEIIEALFRNKISQPCDYTQAGFLNHLMAELKGCFLDNRTRYLFLFIYKLLCLLSSFPGGLVSRVCLQCRRPRFGPWAWKIPWRREWPPTPVFLPGESHGERSLVATVRGVTKELGRTERLTLSVSLHVYYLLLFSDPLRV